MDQWGLLALLLAPFAVQDNYRIVRFVIPGNPPSKARPKFGKGGAVYTPSASRAAEELTAVYFRQAFREPWRGNIALACIFYRATRQRVDNDNLLKHVGDAANGIAWSDDSQITGLIGVIELDPEHPRTVIGIVPHESTMSRDTDVLSCHLCGRKYSGRRSKYCSKECAAWGRRSIRR